MTIFVSGEIAILPRVCVDPTADDHVLATALASPESLYRPHYLPSCYLRAFEGCWLSLAQQQQQRDSAVECTNAPRLPPLDSLAFSRIVYIPPSLSPFFKTMFYSHSLSN